MIFCFPLPYFPLSQQVLYFLLSTLVLTLYIDVVLSLSILIATQMVPTKPCGLANSATASFFYLPRGKMSHDHIWQTLEAAMYISRVSCKKGPYLTWVSMAGFSGPFWQDTIYLYISNSRIVVKLWLPIILCHFYHNMTNNSQIRALCY